MDEENRGGGVLLFAAILTCGIIFMICAYRSKLLEKTRNKVVDAIKSINLKEYDRDDRGQIKRLIRKYSAMVSKAKDRIDIYEIREAFDEALSDFKTSAKKLAESKIDALRDIYEYGMDKFGKPGSEKVNAIAGKYAEQIRHAANREYVESLADEFRNRAAKAFS